MYKTVLSLTPLVFITLICTVLIGCENPDHAANARVVKASEHLKKLSQTNDLVEIVHIRDEVIQMLEDIVKNYPSSTIATKIMNTEFVAGTNITLLQNSNQKDKAKLFIKFCDEDRFFLYHFYYECSAMYKQKKDMSDATGAVEMSKALIEFYQG